MFPEMSFAGLDNKLLLCNRKVTLNYGYKGYGFKYFGLKGRKKAEQGSHRLCRMTFNHYTIEYIELLMPKVCGANSLTAVIKK